MLKSVLKHIGELSEKQITDTDKLINLLHEDGYEFITEPYEAFSVLVMDYLNGADEWEEERLSKAIDERKETLELDYVTAGIYTVLNRMKDKMRENIFFQNFEIF
jgi:regulator of sigma D